MKLQSPDETVTTRTDADDEPTLAITADSLKTIISGAVAEAVRTLAPQDPTDLASVVARATAEAVRAMSPEHIHAKRGEERSVFNPAGERDHPRPDVDGTVYWAGAQLRKDQLTVDEIALVNQIAPGEFYFTGNDGTKMLLRVVNLEPAGSTVRRLNVVLPGLADPNTRTNYPSMTRILTEALEARS